ncbi:MAG TPA: choice-of-anchor tandem repeat GloVer-containing protein, partial [Terriglobia bacterium]
ISNPGWTENPAGSGTVPYCSFGLESTTAKETVQYNLNTEKVLYSFTGGTDGANPYAGLVRDAAGNLYGTTYEGGAHSAGTVFEVSARGRESVLYSFTGGTDGAYPVAGLVRDAAGNLYGTALAGGDLNCSARGFSGCGTVFEVSAGGTESVLHSFTGAPDGSGPYAGLVRDAAGNLYGTTYDGGDLNCGAPYGCGTVFEVSAGGTESVLYSFTGGTDGASPAAGLVRDAAGNLYGTTGGGGHLNCSFFGNSGCGTVFEVSAGGTESVRYTFTGADGDGAIPLAGLARDAAGNLYGTTPYGGDLNCNSPDGCGTVFEVSAGGTERVLHIFTGGADGGNPAAGLVRDAAGNLYGTTLYGGDLNCSNFGLGCGTVFEVSAGGTERVLYSFTGGLDASLPGAGLVRDAAGNLYGTTSYGGDLNCNPPYGCGTVFGLHPMK